MKKFLLTLVFFSGVLLAGKYGFRIITNQGPVVYLVDDSAKLVPYQKMQIDINTYSLNKWFNLWCNNQYDPDSSFNPQYGMNTVDSGGYGGWRWYTVGSGLIGRYVDWWPYADSMALWNKLASMYADSMTTYHVNDEGFVMYRLMDGDSSYFGGISTKYATEGFEELYGILASHDQALDKNPKDTGRHFTYMWGSLDYPPYGGNQIIAWMPHLDLGGPGCYPFKIGDTTTQASYADLDTVALSCEKYARLMHSLGKGSAVLIQCGQSTKHNQRFPTLEELRAASWLSLAYGNDWLSYYSYYHGAQVIDSSQKPYVDTAHFAEFYDICYPDWEPDEDDVDTSSNAWMNLYYVIQEIDSVGDTLANLTWLDGFSRIKCPRGWVQEATVEDGDSADFGMFRHDNDDDRYLLVVNSNIDTSVTNNITIKLRLDGSVTYSIVDVAKDSTLYTRTADTLGYLDTFTVKNITPGAGVLLHLDPTAGGSGSISASYRRATWDVNGRKIAVDTFDRIHICYTDKVNGQRSVWYAYSDDEGSNWYKTKIDTNACWPAVAVDNNGTPYIAYLKLNTTNLSYDSLYLWKDGTHKFVNCANDYLSEESHPSIALDPRQGVGIVYYTKKATPWTYEFELSTLDPVEKWMEPFIPYSYGRIACCFSDSGDAVGVALEVSLNDNELVTKVVKHPSTSDDITADKVEGTHGPPSVANQCVDEIWAVYSRFSEDTIRYKKTSYEDNYEFPDDDTFSVITSSPGDSAEYVQIAEGMPFVVWEDHNGDNSKIYYCSRRNNGTWTTPARVTVSSDSIIERYPHVALDFKEQEARIIWTQWKKSGNNDEEQEDSTVKIKIDTFNYRIMPDSVWVINPNGEETYLLNEDAIGSWWQQEYYLTTPSKPETTFTEITYDYKPQGGTVWEEVPYSRDHYEKFEPYYDSTNGLWIAAPYCYSVKLTEGDHWKEPTNSARIRVTALYGSDTVSDISDENFSIIAGTFIRIIAAGGSGNGWWGGLSVPPSNQTTDDQEMDLLSANKPPDGSSFPWDLANGNKPLSYIPADSTEEIYWEAESYSGLDTVILQCSVDGGESYSSSGGDSTSNSVIIDTIVTSAGDTLFGYTYNGSITWTVPTEPTSEGYLRMMAVDTTSDTVYSTPIGPFIIPPPGGFAYNTYSNQNIMSLNDNGDKIGLVYTAQDQDTASKLSVVYMESDEGLDFSAPDTVGGGRWPSFSRGACFWLSLDSDTLHYAYQLNDTFSTPYTPTSIPQYADSGKFTPVGLTSVNDTVHAIVRVKIATHTVDQGNVIYYYSLLNLYAKFPEASPSSCTIDTLQQMTSTSPTPYTIGDYAPSVVKRDSMVYGAYDDTVNCFFATITPSGNTTTTIGQGSQPSVSCSEGNITYTYLGSGDTTLIRLWRYLDDTTWVERDTFYLDDDAEVFCGEEGLMYGVQREDTFLANLYVYDPISEEYYLTQEYTGYYPHTYIDDEASEFAWITAFADYVDSSTTYMHTERHDMNVILPALYQEADDKRSPYTLYRDTCIHYTSVDVDSAADSLIYRFPNLNTSEDYAVIVEFYTECDSTTQLQITVGSTVDTIQIPANSFSWYEQNVASSTDTLNLAIRRISQFGFVPVSRVLLRRRSSSGFFMSAGGPQSAGPIQIPFCLYQPFPNPFADAATIRYSLPYATHVSLKIYDVSGRLVNKLVDGEVAPGVHELRWTGKDDVNRRCASGVYFVRFTAADYQASNKMVLIK